jgi:small subunit ribosomal protein S9
VAMPTASTTAETNADDVASDVIDDAEHAQADAPAEDAPAEEAEAAELDGAAEGDGSDEAGEIPAEYSTETPEEAAVEETAQPGPSLTGLALATGRRKEAIARVRLTSGTGQWRINGHKLDEYFPNKVHQQLVSEPFVTLTAEGRFDAVALISGGGVTGQAGALRLAIARALAEIDPDNRPALKKAGFLTRDARVKERKKYGLKKARKAPQYSKR